MLGSQTRGGRMEGADESTAFTYILIGWFASQHVFYKMLREHHDYLVICESNPIVAKSTKRATKESTIWNIRDGSR